MILPTITFEPLLWWFAIMLVPLAVAALVSSKNRQDGDAPDD